METFNIKKVIEAYNPDIEKLAKALFPNIAYPRQAFNRILKGEANLDTQQLSKLAQYLGVTVSNLFMVDDTEWSLISKPGEYSLTFTKGEYKAILIGQQLSVYKNDALINVLIIDKKATTIMELIKMLDSSIN